MTIMHICILPNNPYSPVTKGRAFGLWVIISHYLGVT